MRKKGDEHEKRKDNYSCHLETSAELEQLTWILIKYNFAKLVFSYADSNCVDLPIMDIEKISLLWLRYTHKV